MVDVTQPQEQQSTRQRTSVSLPSLTLGPLTKIASFLNVGDICNLRPVAQTFRDPTLTEHLALVPPLQLITNSLAGHNTEISSWCKRDVILLPVDITDQQLEGLINNGVLNYVKILDLHGCTLITDAGLEQLAKLTQLRSLHLSGCKKITDAGLSHLAALNYLTKLTLNECTLITDAGLEQLAKLTHLILLGLSGCDEITDAGFAHLKMLPHLEILDLKESFEITDDDLLQLAEITNLRSLKLKASGFFVDAWLEKLARLTHLTSLELYYCHDITDAEFAHLKKLVNLTVLRLEDCESITSTAFAYLAELPQLASLTIISEHALITDDHIKNLAELTHLTYLELNNCDKITDLGLKYLATLTHLTYLELYYCKDITNAGLLHLVKNLVHLTSLSLHGSTAVKLTVAGLVSLMMLPKLESLDLTDCFNITDDGVKHLNHVLPQLEIIR